MGEPLAYILIAVMSLFLILIFLILFKKKNKKKNKLSPLAGLSMMFIIAGIVFGNYRIVGYSLLGIGIILALVDIFIKLRKK